MNLLNKMKREIVYANQFKKDMKLARRRNLPEEELFEVVANLANDIPLPAKNKDHTLKGEYSGCRECHIQPDWLLIYSKESDGEHSHRHSFRLVQEIV